MDSRALAVENATLFKKNLTLLLEHANVLINQVNSHPDVIMGKVPGTKLELSLLKMAMAAVGASSEFEFESNKLGGLCHGFIVRSCSRWVEIGKNDISYLINHSHDIFGIDPRIPTEQIDAFSQSFTLKDSSGILLVSTTHLAQLWSFLNSLIINSIRYIHYIREPYVNESGKNAYKNKDLYPNVDIREVVKEFKVTGLKFK